MYPCGYFFDERVSLQTSSFMVSIGWSFTEEIRIAAVGVSNCYFRNCWPFGAPW